MRTRFLLAVLATTIALAPATAAPVLVVADNNTGNAWMPPAVCIGGTAIVVSVACAPSITPVAGPPAGYRLSRTVTAPSATSTDGASAFDNGVLAARVERVGVGSALSRARFTESYTYVGSSSSSYVVPFTINRFALGTNSAAPGDVEAARMLIMISITTASVTTAVATLDWRAQSDSASAFTLTLPPSGPYGVTLAPGFLSPPTIVGTTSAFVNGVGGVMAVDLGAFTTGQLFTLDYKMSCLASGTGAGSSFCRVGDPFSIPSGPGFDLQGLAAPVGGVPEPSSWILLIAGFGLVGGTARRRTAITA